MGGVSALLLAATFLVGFAVFLGVLVPAGYFEAEATEKVTILAEHQTIASISYLTAFVVAGILLVVLSLALYDRMQGGAPAMARTGTILGLIWAGLIIASGMVANVGIGLVVDIYETNPSGAGTVWMAVEGVQLGLGGGNEIVGGLWVLLISWAGLRSGELPRQVHYLGIGIGVAGLLTVVPLLDVFGAVEALGFAFGMGLVVWFI